MKEGQYEGGAEEPVNLCGRRRIHRPSGAGQNRTGSRSESSNKTGNWSLLGCNIKTLSKNNFHGNERKKR